MARVIDIAKLSEKYEPLELSLNGTVYKCNAFDQSVVKGIVESTKAKQDGGGNAHDVYAAQVSAAFRVPVEELAGIDLRVLRDIAAQIMEAVFESGESQPKSEQPAK